MTLADHLRRLGVVGGAVELVSVAWLAALLAATVLMARHYARHRLPPLLWMAAGFAVQAAVALYSQAGFLYREFFPSALDQLTNEDLARMTATSSATIVLSQAAGLVGTALVVVGALRAADLLIRDQGRAPAHQ